MSKGRFWIILVAIVTAVVAAYLNHFHNSFHFDDSHTVFDNPYIRSLSYLPSFFVDSHTFSTIPSHASYRPLVTASLAIDYALSGGLSPFFFHLSTFFWFVVLLLTLACFSRRLLATAVPPVWADRAAVLVTAWYGLHPAMAETVNYVVQRADLYAALGALGGIALWAAWPTRRNLGLYLIPPTLGCLAKPTAVMWAPLLCTYIFFIEENGTLELVRRRASRDAIFVTLRRAFPALVHAAVMYILQAVLTSEHFVAGGVSRAAYMWTQPWVNVHYLRLMLLPTELSADTDWQVEPSPWTTPALVGDAVLLLMLVLIYRSSRSREWRPCAFGLTWFLVALLPTAVIPLAEVVNDHRLFFPAIGLALAAGCWLAQLARRGDDLPRHTRPWTTALLPLVAITLPVYAYGTVLRNSVWRDEASLWLDVTKKSPRNGRGLMNYGLTRLEAGDAQDAYAYFRRANELLPTYWNNATNMGIALGALKRNAEAEAEFRRAVRLVPEDIGPRYYFGRWLRDQGRTRDAIEILEPGLRPGVRHLPARELLLDLYVQERRTSAAMKLAGEVLADFPGNQSAATALAVSTKRRERFAELKGGLPKNATTAQLVELSTAAFDAGELEDAATIARDALRRDPKAAGAHNNLAAIELARGRWTAAHEAAAAAWALDPRLTIAQNNLAYAMRMEALARSVAGTAESGAGNPK